MRRTSQSNAKQISELGIAVRNVGFLVCQRANHVPQRAQRAVDEAGFFEGLAARSGERLPLTSSEVDEVELRFPRDGDVRLDFLRLMGVSLANLAGEIEREDGVGAGGAHVHVGDADTAVEEALLDVVVRFGR